MAALPNDTNKPATDNAAALRAILILTADGTEDLEFFYPYYRFIEEGFKVDVVTPDGGPFKGKQGLGLKSTKALSDIDPEDYELLYIPGGKAPEALKKIDAVLELVESFVEAEKPVAAICHAPQILAAAGVIKGKRISAFPEIKGEVEAAGATFVDSETLVDGLFITARWPGDLPSHLKQTLDTLRHLDDDVIEPHAAA